MGNLSRLAPIIRFTHGEPLDLVMLGPRLATRVPNPNARAEQSDRDERDPTRPSADSKVRVRHPAIERHDSQKGASGLAR